MLRFVWVFLGLCRGFGFRVKLGRVAQRWAALPGWHRGQGQRCCHLSAPCDTRQHQRAGAQEPPSPGWHCQGCWLWASCVPSRDSVSPKTLECRGFALEGTGPCRCVPHRSDGTQEPWWPPGWCHRPAPPVALQLRHSLPSSSSSRLFPTHFALHDKEKAEQSRGMDAGEARAHGDMQHSPLPPLCGTEQGTGASGSCSGSDTRAGLARKVLCCPLPCRDTVKAVLESPGGHQQCCRCPLTLPGRKV